MPNFAVTIRATVTKTLTVEAEDELAAINAAHQDFTVECETGCDEDYNQETLSVDRVK